MTQPTSKGGLGLGMTIVNVVFLLIIIGAVAHLSIAQEKDISAGVEKKIILAAEEE